MLSFSSNYLIVLIAAVASFVLGFLWYGPVFGKHWMKLMGFTSKSVKSMKLSPGSAMALGFVSTFVTAWFLAIVISATGAEGVWEGLMVSSWIWFGFIATTTLGGFLWEGKTLKLYLFNVVYHLVNFALMGSIISYWG